MVPEEEYMMQAIDLAKKGRGFVSPNPLVGCVIVKNNKIIGEGYHAKYGANHAEVVAFNNCSEPPEGADLYVNLEPCSIFGKTPPCVDRIIENGIKNVYIGTKDFNPSVNGSGIDKLERSKINVFTDILDKECYELNRGFFKWIESGSNSFHLELNYLNHNRYHLEKYHILIHFLIFLIQFLLDLDCPM